MQYLPMQDKMVYNIGDIYAQNKHDNKMMLSPYPSDFWKPYRDNPGYFDRRFMTLFKTFYPYNQETEEGRESVADDFRYDVYAHLMANDKRYSELFRIQTIPDDDAYKLTNNVDYTESYEEANGRDITYNKGEQIDSEDLSATMGAQDIDTTNTVSAYNDSGYAPKDKSEVDQGERTDTEDNERTYGAREDTTGETGSKEYTLHKVGNMGVQDVNSMLQRHWDGWANLFDFYKLIFDEIAQDLLRGC